MTLNISVLLLLTEGAKIDVEVVRCPFPWFNEADAALTTLYDLLEAPPLWNRRLLGTVGRVEVGG
jgi:hypothetical protein